MKKLLLCFLLSIPTALVAQVGDTTDVYDLSLEELLNVKISVATKTEQDIDDAPGNLIVITRRQIMDMNARTLKDVLNVFVPGMDALPASIKYGDRVETVYSRGINSDFSQQILYLFNGKNKFNETTFGQPLGFIEFTLEAIDRIEISTSPVPLQGGSAVTIVNLITKDQTAEGAELFLNTGFTKSGLLSKKFTTLFGGNLEGWHLGASLQFYDDNGIARNSKLGTGPGGGSFPRDPRYLRDGTKSAYNMTLNIKSPNRKFELGTWYKYANQDGYLSGILPWASGHTQNYIGSQWQNYINYKPVKGLDIVAGYMWHYLAYPGFPFYNTQTNYDSYVEVDYTKQLGSKSQHSLLVGGKIQREGQTGNDTYYWDPSIQGFRDTTAYPLAPNQSRKVLALFADDTWEVTEKLSVVAGMRLDHYQNFANTKLTAINPRLAISYKLNSALAFKALYASAIRPPTLYELTGQTHLPLYGNSNLKQEQIRSFETNLIFKKEKFKLKISAYNEIYNDQIVYLPIDKNLMDRDTTQAFNAGKTNVLGLDFNLNYYLQTNTYFFLNAAKLNTKNEAKEKVYFLPSLYVNGGVNLRLNSWNINFTSFYRGKRPLPSSHTVNTEHASGAIFHSNLSVTLNLTKQFKIYMLTQNLFDNKSAFPLSIDGYFIPLRSRVANLGLVFNL